MVGRPKFKMQHPGTVLLRDYMEPFSISQNRLARDLGLSPTLINRIVQGKGPITADTALRLERYFGSSAEFWLNMQRSYDINAASRELGPALDAIQMPEAVRDHIAQTAARVASEQAEAARAAG